jgi:hypothetical protein
MAGTYFRCEKGHISLKEDLGCQHFRATRTCPEEAYDLCPVCGSDDLAEVTRCGVCGEVVEDDAPHVKCEEEESE